MRPIPSTCWQSPPGSAIRVPGSARLDVQVSEENGIELRDMRAGAGQLSAAGNLTAATDMHTDAHAAIEAYQHDLHEGSDTVIVTTPSGRKPRSTAVMCVSV